MATMVNKHRFVSSSARVFVTCLNTFALEGSRLRLSRFRSASGVKRSSRFIIRIRSGCAYSFGLSLRRFLQAPTNGIERRLVSIEPHFGSRNRDQRFENDTSMLVAIDVEGSVVEILEGSPQRKPSASVRSNVAGDQSSGRAGRRHGLRGTPSSGIFHCCSIPVFCGLCNRWAKPTSAAAPVQGGGINSGDAHRIITLRNAPFFPG